MKKGIMDTVNDIKIGRIKRSRLLAKASWLTFKTDKKLVAIPLIALIIGVPAIILFGVSAIIQISINLAGTSNPIIAKVIYALFALLIYFILYFAKNIVEATLFIGITARFNGQKPSIKGALKAVIAKIWPLMQFSFLMSSIGLAVKYLGDRLPFIGRIGVNILGGAWELANFFAIPAIASSAENLNPKQATQQSISIIKRVWGENVLISLGISLIELLSVLIFAAISLAFAWTLNSQNISTSPAFYFAIIGLIVMSSVFIVLEATVKAAVYHYATTGESPVQFNKNVLQQTFTQKKSQKIFAGN